MTRHSSGRDRFLNRSRAPSGSFREASRTPPSAPCCSISGSSSPRASPARPRADPPAAAPRRRRRGSSRRPSSRPSGKRNSANPQTSSAASVKASARARRRRCSSGAALALREQRRARPSSTAAGAPSAAGGGAGDERRWRRRGGASTEALHLDPRAEASTVGRGSPRGRHVGQKLRVGGSTRPGGVHVDGAASTSAMPREADGGWHMSATAGGVRGDRLLAMSRASSRRRTRRPSMYTL